MIYCEKTLYRITAYLHDNTEENHGSYVTEDIAFGYARQIKKNDGGRKFYCVTVSAVTNGFSLGLGAV